MGEETKGRGRVTGSVLGEPPSEEPESPVGRKLAETVRQVQAFQIVRQSKGSEATPAGWEPGQPTLKPGPDLVGNVWTVWKPGMER